MDTISDTQICQNRKMFYHKFYIEGLEKTVTFFVSLKILETKKKRQRTIHFLINVK